MQDKTMFDTSCLPDAKAKDRDFLDSSFFSTKPGQCLPTPSEVTGRSPDFPTNPRPAPIRFENLNLIVKFGLCVGIEEALCLRLIKKHLADRVPVPEVYGWRVDGPYVFIYMQLIQGETLHNRWDSLRVSDRELICNQLGEIVSSLRQVEQDPMDTYIGVASRYTSVGSWFTNKLYRVNYSTTITRYYFRTFTTRGAFQRRTFQKHQRIQ
jgi:hypothetical protein